MHVVPVGGFSICMQPSCWYTSFDAAACTLLFQESALVLLSESQYLFTPALLPDFSQQSNALVLVTLKGLS